ncbi:hypothetical protein TrVE_jg8105 [Triparma verrucosa]|uniref:Transmembrane protein n=1 Tax=Triparma verrucosa TaxID=1606542 RepID=A0A9W7BLM4_9STRA|nr:hypothetical protein TrVE_jg8105 [Triparma verrucosa]
MEAELRTALRALVNKYGKSAVSSSLAEMAQESTSTPQQPGRQKDEEMLTEEEEFEEEEKKFDQRRRMSNFLGDSSAAMANALVASMPTSMLQAKSFAQALLEKEISSLVRSYLTTIKLSNKAEDAVNVWFDKKFPNGDKYDAVMTNVLANIKRFLTALAKIIRPLMKMSRIGVATRVFISLVVGYFDLTTDLLVANQYLENGLTGWFYGCILFVAITLFFHVQLAILQYRARGWFVCVKQALLAVLCLSPVVEGFQVWVGTEQPVDLLFEASIMLSCIKATEVACESLPEAVIQLIALQQIEYDDLSNVLVFSLISSFFAISFIITDANLSVARSYSASVNDEYHDYIPENLKKAVICFGANFLFLIFYGPCFVLAVSSIYYLNESFIPIGIMMAVEYMCVVSFKLYHREFVFAFMQMPTKLDPVIGAFCNLMYYLTTCAAPLNVVSHPWAMGPVLWYGLIIWRYVSNTLIVLYCADIVGEKTWLSSQMLLTTYFTCMFLSLLSWVVFTSNKEYRNMKRNPFRFATAKSFTAEAIFDTDDRYSKNEFKWTSRLEERRAFFIGFLHPNCLPSSSVERFLTEELKKFEGVPPDSPSINFLTAKWHSQTRLKMKWYGGNISKNVSEALDRLPVYEKLSEEEIIMKQRTEVAKGGTKVVPV